MAPARCQGTRLRLRAARRLGDGQRWGGGLWLEGCGGVFCGAGLAGSGSGVGCTGAGAGAPPSSTERGAALCADMKARTREMNRKIPAHHQVILVSKVVACRPPMNCSVPAPPPSDASPPPWPACSNTAVVRIRASRVRRISRKLYMRPGKYLGSAGLHKLRPAFGIERGAAHQDAIELAFGEEGGGVLRVHTSAVEDPRRRGASACQPAADLPVHGGGVLGGRVAAGADRPHRLIRDHDPGQRRAVETAQRGGELADDHRQRVPRVALRERFSDAQHGPESRPERRAHFATSVFVGLTEYVASLGMADQRGAGSSLERERGGNRTGERALRSEEHTSELQSLAYLVCRLLLE